LREQSGGVGRVLEVGDEEIRLQRERPRKLVKDVADAVDCARLEASVKAPIKGRD
jgi:hypothetical protein